MSEFPPVPIAPPNEGLPPVVGALPPEGVPPTAFEPFVDEGDPPDAEDVALVIADVFDPPAGIAPTPPVAEPVPPT